jgi:sialate O-acetylesterase
MATKLFSAAALCLLATGASASATLLFNGFASHMVIQRDVNVPLWGSASAPGVTVSVSFSGSVYRATADSEARWVVTLPPTTAGGPYEILVNASDGASALLEDVLVGEVYICRCVVCHMSCRDAPVLHSVALHVAAAARATWTCR